MEDAHLEMAYEDLHYYDDVEEYDLWDLDLEGGDEMDPDPDQDWGW